MVAWLVVAELCGSIATCCPCRGQDWARRQPGIIQAVARPGHGLGSLGATPLGRSACAAVVIAMSELDFNVSCGLRCCPAGYDPVSHCSRTYTDVALYSAESGQVVAAVFLVLFSYLFAANAQEAVRIMRDSRTLRHKSTGMLTVFGLGAGHALSRIYIAFTIHESFFMLLPGDPELPPIIREASKILYVLGIQALLSEVAFAILVQLQLFRRIRNPFKSYGSPFVQMALLGVSFGSAMFISVLLAEGNVAYSFLGFLIFNIVIGSQILLLTYLIWFFGRALERALLIVDRTGSLQVDAAMRRVMTQHRQKFVPLGLISVLDILVLLLTGRATVTQGMRTLNYFLITAVPFTIEVCVNWVILKSLTTLRKRASASVSPDNTRLESATATTSSSEMAKTALSSHAPSA